MGSLSNLYISQSYQSLIHLGSDTAATSTPTQLEDGVGTGIGIYVNTNGEVSASSFSGSINGIGNVSAFSSSVNSRINNISAPVGYVTTSSFNAYTQSTNGFTASISTSVGLLQTFSGSQYKTDSSSFDSRIDGLETFSASADSRYVQNSQTSSMAVSSSTYAVSATNASDILVYVKNTTGFQINKGKVVRITSATGDNALIGTASWDNDGTSANTLGFVTANIANDAFGYVMTQGSLIGVNTNGFTAGQVLYLSASGDYTNVIPPAPYHEVRLGQVLRPQINNGSIYVSIQNGYELGELHDVNIVSASNNDLLAYNSASGQWENKSIGTLGLATTGSNSFTGSQIVSGSLTVLGNLTAYTASFITVTSSVVVGGNTILLNTFTPAVRYGGIEVVDSGSTGLTGSMLWDSVNDVWLYVNPSGSSYASARLISGPKSLTLGSEPTLTQNRVPKADDGDHLVDSQISDDGTTVSVTNAFSASTIVGLGNATVFSQSVDSRINSNSSSIFTNTNNIASLTSKTGSYATTGSNNFVGNQSITGSLILSSSAVTELQVIGAVEITGSVAGNITALTVASSTASIDFSRGTFFTLTIPSSSVTYITGSNLKPGTTANIVLTQQATTGSVRFESSLFKFPSGSINTGSAVASAVDIVSVMSVNTTTLLSVGANRLI